MTLSLLFNQPGPRSASLGVTESADAGTAIGAVSIAGALAATETAHGLPGAFWSVRYWAAGFWANGYWAPNTAPNHVIVGASLAATEASDASVLGSYWASRFWATGYWSANYWSSDSATGAAVRIGAALSLADAADSLVAAGTAATGGVGSISASLAAREDDDSLIATAIRVGIALPAGAVGWWPQAPRQRRVVAGLTVLDDDDRAAVRVLTIPFGVARLAESPDVVGSIAASVLRGTLSSFEAIDRIVARGTVDWSDVIAQEDEAFGLGSDGLLISELMREAA